MISKRNVVCTPYLASGVVYYSCTFDLHHYYLTINTVVRRLTSRVRFDYSDDKTMF